MLVHSSSSTPVSPASAVSPVAPCDASPARPCDKLEPSPSSDWQAAYGPGPCHRAATTPQAWREAVEEKRRIEARLLTPFGAAGATPAALIGVAQRLQKKAPLPALLAFRLAGPEARDGRQATDLMLAQLRKEGRYEELTAYAASAVQRFPDLAVQLMNWGVETRYLPLCRLATATGADLTRARRFTPELAANVNDWELVRHLCDDPRGIPPDDWNHAFGGALVANELEMARVILPVFLESLRQRGNPWAPSGVDLTWLPTAAAQDEALRIMQAAGCEPKAILHATARSYRHTVEETAAACCRLRDALFTPEAWQAELNALCDRALQKPHEVDPYEFRVLRALGGQCTDIAGGIAAVERDCPRDRLAEAHEPQLTHLLCASGDANLQIKKKSVRMELLRRLVACQDRRAVEMLDQLADAGIGLQSGDVAQACGVLNKHAWQPAILRPLLRMGFPASRSGIVTACPKANQLESLQLLVEAGASAFEYDDEFQTAIDVATQPEVVAYLRDLGLEPMPKPELRAAPPTAECSSAAPVFKMPLL